MKVSLLSIHSGMCPCVLAKQQPAGVWLNNLGNETGFYGGGVDWATAPIAYAPNPVVCQWKGPNVSDFDCSTCTLGFEPASATDRTCVKPDFRPYKDWEGSPRQANLTFQDAVPVIVRDAKANTITTTYILKTKREYTIPGPGEADGPLEPKERKFVGYEQPYTKIRYELDFSLGQEVDIGCGTAVVGDASQDKPITKDHFDHPFSMNEFNFVWAGRWDLTNLTETPGYYPWKCPRYHRFSVTRRGNFTFDTCASVMPMALNLYKKANQSASEPRMTSARDGFSPTNSIKSRCTTTTDSTKPSLLGW